MDKYGNVFVGGISYSTDFPICTTCPGYLQSTFIGGVYDLCLMKFDNDGNILWSTFFGGGGINTYKDDVHGVTTNVNGDFIVTGYTNSPDFTTLDAGTYYQPTLGGNIGGDAFVLCFENDGTLKWSTFFGGSVNDEAHGVATDRNGNIYVTGYTKSADFPVCTTCSGYFQPYVNSEDMFLSMFDSVGNLQWSTFYGHTGTDLGYDLIVDSSRNLFVSGITSSLNFPLLDAGTYYDDTNGGGIDAFILKFDPNHNLTWGTFYGGSDWEWLDGEGAGGFGGNLAIDQCQDLYCSFSTVSLDIPTQTPRHACGYFSNTYNGGSYDLFITKFTNNGDRLWGTYFGGNGTDIRAITTVDIFNDFYIVGEWAGYTISESSYPLFNQGGLSYFDGTHNGGNDDGFIAKFGYQLDLVGSEGGTSGCNCTATVTPCGVGPFTYQWSTGGTTQTIGNLCGGNYEVIVTDLGAWCSPDDGRDTIEVTICTTLDIDYISIDAVCKGDHVLLNWELDVDRSDADIKIQRSRNGARWETITTIQANEGISAYEYLDDHINLNSEPAYYRLKINNDDGGYTTSEIVSANCSDQQGAWLYPNPTRGELNLLLKTDYEGQVQILLRNPLGQIVGIEKVQHEQSSAIHVLEVQGLSKGTYYAEVHLGDQVYNQKIIKK